MRLAMHGTQVRHQHFRLLRRLVRQLQRVPHQHLASPLVGRPAYMLDEIPGQVQSDLATCVLQEVRHVTKLHFL